MADNKAANSPLSVTQTEAMKALMADSQFCKEIARGEASFMQMIDQAQRDLVKESNFQEVGAVVLAMKKIQDQILVIATKGRVLIKESTKDTPT